MRRTPRWFNIAISSLVVGLVIGAVVAGVLYFTRGTVRHLSSGESSYQAGLTAVREGNDATALTRFHEAILSAENMLSDLEGSVTEPAVDKEQMEQNQKMLGHAYWLKHRAVKARGFTKLLVDKKPLPTYEGQAEGTPDQVMLKLSALRLPDEASRQEAVVCLREAAYRLSTNIDVLREAVATEIQFEPMQWNHVHAFATTLAELDPQDERALYLLARLEYEQPVSVKADSGPGTMPMPALKRSRDRMVKGLEYLTRLKSVEKPIRWRTTYLEAQMQAWLVQYYRNPSQLRPDAEQQAMTHLRGMLLDNELGVMAKVKKDDKLNVSSRLDLQGLLGLHQMALELVLDESRRSTGSQAVSDVQQRPWAEALQRQMDACAAVAGKAKSPARIVEVTDFMVQASLKVMPTLVASRPEAWAAYRNQTLELAQEAKGSMRPQHPLPLRLADLLTREGQWLELCGDKLASQARMKEAMDWLDIGIKSFPASATVTPLLASMHEGKLRLLMSLQPARTTVEVHLDALRASKLEPFVAAAAYYEGIMAEREGRLQLARTQLEQATRSSRSDLSRRALTLLVPIYLTLEMPEPALNAINDLNRLMTKLDAMNHEERNWLFSMVRGPEELLPQRVQALVMAANHARQQLLTAKSPSSDLRNAPARYEAEVKSCLEKAPQNANCTGRMYLAWTQYLLQHDRAEEAKPCLAVLQRTHPDWLETLQLEIGCQLAEVAQETKASGVVPEQSPTTVLKIDSIIQAYLKRPQANAAAKLVWLKWLESTRRTDLIQQYLDDAAFFTSSAPDKKLKALACIYLGKREESQVILQALPKDPQLDVALLQAARTLSEQQQAISSALQHHQDAGLFRTWSAALSLAQGDYAEACRGFVQCLEYPRVRPLVRQGLTQALAAWAKYQPLEARKQAAEALQSYPSESSLLLGYALASLQLGEIGSLTDAGNQVKDMATALKAYEAAMVQEGQEASTASWIETQCWLQAERRDWACIQALRTIELNPQMYAAHVLAIQLHLESTQAQDWDKALAIAIQYAKVQPQSTDAVFCLGRCYARVGKLNQAMNLYKQIMEQHPRFAPVYPAACMELMTSGKPESMTAAVQVLDRWKAALPTDSGVALMEVQLAVKQGKVTQARSVVERVLVAIETGPGNSIQTVGLTSEKQQTLALLKADALCQLGQSMAQAGENSQAIACYQKAIDLVPEYETAQLLLGNQYLVHLKQCPPASASRQQTVQAAVAIYTSIYRRHPGHAVAGNNLAWLMATELNNGLEAYRIMQEVRVGKHRVKPLAGDMMSVALLDTLGVIYQKMNKPEQQAERLEIFETARRRYHDDPRVIYHLAQAYLASKQKKLAQQAFQSARTLVAKSSLAMETQKSLAQEIEQGMKLAQQ